MEFRFNPGELYEWKGEIYAIQQSCPNDVYPKFFIQRPGFTNGFWIEGNNKVKEINPIPLNEAHFIGLGFQKITEEGDVAPEYEIVLHGVIKIRFMYSYREEAPYYYLINPCMGPLFFEYVHEVQRLLRVFEAVKKTSVKFK